MADKNIKILIPDEVIMSKIYLIRGRKVMLDKDLAELYGVETKQLKRAVRRNIERFPEDFMFEMTKEELENWRCQIGTTILFSEHDRNILRGTGRSRYMCIAKDHRETARRSNLVYGFSYLHARTKNRPIHSYRPQLENEYFASLLYSFSEYYNY